MNIRDAYIICNPLASPPLGIDAHLREEQAGEDLQSEVDGRVRMLTGDRQGINTLRFEDTSTEDLIDALVLEIITHPIDSRTIEQIKEFRLKMFVAAAKLAGKKLAEDIRQAREDAAVTQYETRQLERFEP